MQLHMIKMDDVDREILKILQENYRISYQELSKKLGKAASTIHNRVQNMVNEGIIKEFDTIIDPFKVGFEAIAVLGISVDPLKVHDVAKEIASFKQVQLVATSTGDHDLIVRIIEKDEKSLWRFIKNKIKTIEGVKPEMDVSSFIDIYKMTHKIEF